MPSDLVAALLIDADPGGMALYLERIKKCGKRHSVLRLCHRRHRVAQCIFGGMRDRALGEQPFGATYLLSEDSDKLVSVEPLLDSLTFSEESWLSR